MQNTSIGTYQFKVDVISNLEDEEHTLLSVLSKNATLVHIGPAPKFPFR